MARRDFTAALLRTGNGHELELVPEFGGLTNHLRFAIDGEPIDVIAGLDSREALRSDRAFRNVLLFPFVNRLDGGRYRYNDREYRFELNEPERNNALHGFLFRLQPQITLRETTECHEAEVVYDYDGGKPAYPFAVQVKLVYRLFREGSLTLHAHIENRHAGTIPVGFGWHPYFTLGERVDDLDLELPPCRLVEVDRRLLPTGQTRAFSEFRAPAAVKDRIFDNCFELYDPERSGKAVTRLWSPTAGYGLELWQQTGGHAAFNYLQVCTPPDRQSIAIEPVSCGIDAFNTGKGLVHREPGQTVTLQCGVRLLKPSDC